MFSTSCDAGILLLMVPFGNAILFGGKVKR
jgi:hypothetical protein